MQIIQTDPPKIRHNVVLFGGAGGGKSSIINMLMGSDVAPTNSAATGCTLSSTPYQGTIHDQKYTFWDTVGKVPDLKAVGALYHLLRKLEGGVSLLVFCMGKPKNAWKATQQNWELFKNIIGQDKVPVVIVVTHLEQENNMDEWWPANRWVFAKHKIIPSSDVHREYGARAPESDIGEGQVKADEGAACITAIKGKFRRGKYALQDEYDQSCWKIKKLIYESHLSEPWKVERVQWFQEITREVRAGFWICGRFKSVVDYLDGRGVYSLMDRWGLKDEEEARKIVQILEDGPVATGRN